MSTIRLEQVAGNDIGLKAALMDAHLPTDDVEDHGRTFFKAVSADDRIVGFSGVERCGDDFLLRSVVVLPNHRGQSLGGALVEQTWPASVGMVTSFSQRQVRHRSSHVSDFLKSSGTASPQPCWRPASFRPYAHLQRPS